MTELINLRTIRKRRKREERAAAAESNRAKSGLTRYQKQLAKISNSRSKLKLDGHKLMNTPKKPSPDKH
jgi:flagellar biosynthesis chaperone FliJ